MAISQRIIDSLKDRRQDFQESISYKQQRISELVKQITGIQSEIEELEGRIKENDEAIQKLLKE